MANLTLQVPTNYKDISTNFGLLSWKVNGKICFSIDYRCLPGGANIEVDTISNPTGVSIPNNMAFYTTDGRVVYSENNTIKDPEPSGEYSGRPTLIWQIW